MKRNYEKIPEKDDPVDQFYKWAVKNNCVSAWVRNNPKEAKKVWEEYFDRAGFESPWGVKDE